MKQCTALNQCRRVFLAFCACLLVACASNRPPVGDSCPVSPMLELTSIAPGAGASPVWLVEGRCWRPGHRGSKSVVIVDRQFEGDLELRGKSASGEVELIFQDSYGERDGRRYRKAGRVPALVIPDAHLTSVTPGGAPEAEMARYAFHMASIDYSGQGCWHFTAVMGGKVTDIYLEKVYCDSEGNPAEWPRE